MTGPSTDNQSNSAAGTGERRASERFTCDAPVYCQLYPAWNGEGLKWVARVRDVSSGGLCLVLGRRFEPGAGLAIDLPLKDGAAPSTVLARVVYARREPDGLWALHCKFLSPLAEEEMQTLLHAPPGTELPRPVPEKRHGAVISAVHFRGVRPEGGVVAFVVRRLGVPGEWQPTVGRTIALRLGGPNTKGVEVRVRVDACRSTDGRWFVDCTFVGPVPADLLRLPADRI
jgi:hypothetical protein